MFLYFVKVKTFILYIRDVSETAESLINRAKFIPYIRDVSIQYIKKEGKWLFILCIRDVSPDAADIYEEA